jgi:cytochrome P450
MSDAAAPSYRPFGRATWRDPFPLYRALRERDPVHHAAEYGFWVLTRFEHVFDAARDAETFSSAKGVTIINELEELGLPPTILQSDPPLHTKYRGLVGKLYTQRRVAESEPWIRAFVRTRVEALRAKPEADFVAGLARSLPAAAVGRALGVPDSDLPSFEVWAAAFSDSNEAGHSEHAAPALAELGAYIARMIEERRRAPREDLVSVFLRAQQAGVELTDAEIVAFLYVFLSGGSDTVAGALSVSAELLTRHRDERARLLREPGLIRGAVDELVRLASPAQGLARVATRDALVGGVRIPAGSRVLLCFAAANRDEREFGPDAERLDVGRRIRRTVAFGSGVHYCLGAALARLEIRVALEELLRLCPRFAVDADAGTFADGMFIRRYETLPFRADAG